MKFELAQSFDTDLATFERALADPRLPGVLERGMPSMKKIEELDRSDDGRLFKRRVRYVPNQEVPSFARGKLKPEMLEWVVGDLAITARPRPTFFGFGLAQSISAATFTRHSSRPML